jgi:hypothetical protein
VYVLERFRPVYGLHVCASLFCTVVQGCLHRCARLLAYHRRDRRGRLSVCSPPLGPLVVPSLSTLLCAFRKSKRKKASKASSEASAVSSASIDALLRRATGASLDQAGPFTAASSSQ